MLPISLFGMMDSGLQNDRKPLFLPEKAFQTLDNAYAWRGRVVKRQGIEFLGRLERCFQNINFFPITSNPYSPSSLLSVTGFVRTANNANPGQITTMYAHGLQTGDHVIISNIVGATGYNNKDFTITVIDATNFTVGQDATLFGAYISGGVWISNRSLAASEPLAEIACGSISLTYITSGNLTNVQSDSFKEGFIANITQATNAVVTSRNFGADQTHHLTTGDVVTFKQVAGMTEINDLVTSITVLSPTTFSCDQIDSTTFSAYTANTGIFICDPAIPNGILSGTVQGNITNITTGLNPIVTSNVHTMLTGGVVLINGVTGMPELNGQYFTIIVLNINQFQLNTTTTGIYGGGGTWLTPAYNDTGSTINYITGNLVIVNNPGAGPSLQISFCYYPTLPVMGIWDREIASINEEQVIFFDTKYAYVFVSGQFQEFIPGFIWGGTDADFFWATNYRGITADLRYFFVTNFVNDAADPMRYFDGTTWIDFAPGIAGTKLGADTTFMFQAKLLIPYYGRLLAFNTWEGTTIGNSVNIYNRCRFSQIGNPVQQTVVGPPFIGGAWRSDVFGKGGFIDAPTNEAIISVAFFKNTLIVGFERSMWELRYVGEYGLPFIWNRISSDFGTESTFSTVVFDDGVLSVGNRAIVNSTSLKVNRIDLAIPDQVFAFRNNDGGIARVNGERDFERELVYWCYSDAVLQKKFPNYVLMFNYRNNTYARFRDNVTFFGTFQNQGDLITWDSLTVFWEDEGVFWDDVGQEGEERVVAGNQQGFVHFYLSKYQQINDISLSIQGIDLTVSPNILTIPNHNLLDAEIIEVTMANYVTPPTNTLNDQIFQVTVIDDNNISLTFWDTDAQVYTVTPEQDPVVYIGCGRVTLFPQMFVQTKDFNPFQTEGKQFKLTYIDFLTDSTPQGVMSVVLGGNSTGSRPLPTFIGNVLTGNTQSEQYLEYPYFVTTPTQQDISDYAWHRFYATMAAQFINVILTYDNDLMNLKSTHESTWVLNALTLWCRKAGKLPF